MVGPGRLAVGFLACVAAAFSGAGAQAEGPSASASASASPEGGLAEGLEALRTSDYAAAERVLARVRGGDRGEAQVALSRVFLATGRTAEAARVADPFLAQGSRDLRAGATAVRAEALFTDGNVAGALKLLESSPESRAGAADVSAPSLRVRLLLGEYRIESGHRQDAEAPLLSIVDAYNGGSLGHGDAAAEALALVGRAAHLLRSAKDANDAFNESERAGKGSPAPRFETLAFRAALFLDKYDPGHAEDVLAEALAIAPNDPSLLVARARVKLEQTLDFGAAEALLAHALAVNPRYAPAFAVRASIALRDMDLARADAAIHEGLAASPANLELLALRAAACFLADDAKGYDAAKKAAFARNAEYSRFFAVVGELAEWEHRYDAIVAMMKEATTLDPEDEKAWAELGLTELRSGDEAAGVEALRRAWSLDHFNVRVYNTLNLYEKTLPDSYQTAAGPVFQLRYAKAEKKVLERYVPRMLEEAWGSMKARYAFVPKGPVGVELYATREQFSVRTSGLPNIGIQGVCFGKVVAALSPAAEPFNWGNVLWHELGHVFAIQLSKSHVPRWFTEGLSEYETIARRPEWQRELDPELYLAIQRGSLPGAADMNQAFTHAEDGADMTVAYYASSQMLVFTVERFGMPKVVQALTLWGEGLRTSEVIARAFGVDVKEYDAQYRAWELGKLGRYRGQFIPDDRAPPLDAAKANVAKAPGDAAAHVALALSILHARRGKEPGDPLTEVNTALRLDPSNPMAHYLAARFAKGDPAAATGHLASIQKAGGDGYAVQAMLAELAAARHDAAGRRKALEAAARWDPSQADAWRGLFELATEEKRDADALEALRKLAPLEQHDRKAWRLLLERLVEQKAWEEAKKIGEAALFVDVENPRIHEAYARALGATGDHPKALFELESALACAVPPPEAAAVHVRMAEELTAMGTPAASESAKAHLLEAQKLDPNHAAARALPAGAPGGKP